MTHYRNDHWTLEDTLGTGAAGDLLARLALEADPPFCARVVGKWGSGKTSVLRRAFATLGGRPVQQSVPLGEDVSEYSSNIKKDRAKQLLENPEGAQLRWENPEWDKWRYDADNRPVTLYLRDDLKKMAARTLCVWFSPWQHQTAENPMIPLLLEIRAQYRLYVRMRQGLKDYSRKAALAGAALLERVIDAAASLTVQKNMKIAGGTTEAVRRAWREAEVDLTVLADGQRFHLLFDDAVKNVLEGLPGGEAEGQPEGRLIVFIDDLDRCEEAVVVELLESIKLYLSSPRCVFILGMDDAAALGALKRRWPGRSDDNNREYLEKLFQVTLPVPAPAPKRVVDAIREQLSEHNILDAQECAETIERLLEPVPRKIKNFTNTLCAAWQLFSLKGKQYITNETAKSTTGEIAGVKIEPAGSTLNEAQRFIMIQYLRAFHQPVWRLLERQPKALRVLHRVLNGSTDQLPEEDDFDGDDQRLMKELFVRAFLHVLRPDEIKDDEEARKFHRNLALDQAVARLEERLDRKRSDEFFKTFFVKLFDQDEILDERYLRLA